MMASSPSSSFPAYSMFRPLLQRLRRADLTMQRSAQCLDPASCNRCLSSLSLAAVFAAHCRQPARLLQLPSRRLSPQCPRAAAFSSKSKRKLRPTAAAASAPSPSATAPSSSATAAPLPSLPAIFASLHPVYEYDQSRYFRRVTLAATAALLLVWLPLTYAALFLTSPSLYLTIIGPVSTVLLILACHFRASRVIAFIRSVGSNSLVLSTHTATGSHQHHTVAIADIRTTEAIRAAAATGSSVSRDSSDSWPIQLKGRQRFFLIDKRGSVLDKQAMRRVVGWQTQLMTEEEKEKAKRDVLTGPPTLGRAR